MYQSYVIFFDGNATKVVSYFFGSFSQNGAGITEGYAGFSCNIGTW